MFPMYFAPRPSGQVAAVPSEVRGVLPAHYAESYAARGMSYWNGPIGAAIRRLTPAIMPGLPLELVTAFVAPARASDNTTEGTGAAGQSVAFHEIGLLQVPAGPRDGPAPNPDPSVSHNAWGKLATHADVVRALGRPATMSTSGWRTAIDDQIAVGTANLRGDYTDVVANLPPALRPEGPGTPWGAWLTMMAFSAGPGGAAAVATRYAAALAAVDDYARPGELVRAMATEIARGEAMGGTPGRHSNRAHSVVRTWQKFELARAIARGAGRDPAFFDLGFGDRQPALEELIARGSRGLPPQPGLDPAVLTAPAQAVTRGANVGLVVAVVGVGLAAAAVVWSLLRRQPVPMSEEARRELAVARAGGWGTQLASMVGRR